jgi:hypothetical protein
VDTIWQSHKQNIGYKKRTIISFLANHLYFDILLSSSLPKDLNNNALKTIILPSAEATIAFSTGTCITNAITNEIAAAAALKGNHSLTA